jgi:serine/threonine protein kinase
MKDFFKDKKYFYIIYELAEYGNLLDYYRKTETFSEDDVFQFFFQILLAVDYLHKQGIIHRNLKVYKLFFILFIYFLKLQNILLDVHHNLKLSNLKYACEEQNSTKLSK